MRIVDNKGRLRVYNEQEEVSEKIIKMEHEEYVEYVVKNIKNTIRVREKGKRTDVKDNIYEMNNIIADKKGVVFILTKISFNYLAVLGASCQVYKEDDNGKLDIESIEILRTHTCIDVSYSYEYEEIIDGNKRTTQALLKIIEIAKNSREKVYLYIDDISMDTAVLETLNKVIEYSENNKDRLNITICLTGIQLISKGILNKISRVLIYCPIENSTIDKLESLMHIRDKAVQVARNPDTEFEAVVLEIDYDSNDYKLINIKPNRKEQSQSEWELVELNAYMDNNYEKLWAWLSTFFGTAVFSATEIEHARYAVLNEGWQSGLKSVIIITGIFVVVSIVMHNVFRQMAMRKKPSQITIYLSRSKVDIVTQDGTITNIPLDKVKISDNYLCYIDKSGTEKRIRLSESLIDLDELIFKNERLREYGESESPKIKGLLE